jgi:hypothetical protein
LAIEEADARALAGRLSEQSDRGERRVQIITVFEATDAEPQTMTLGLQIERLEIWDDALTVRLRSLDVAPLRHQKLSSASPLQHLLHPPAALRPMGARLTRWRAGDLGGSGLAGRFSKMDTCSRPGAARRGRDYPRVSGGSK